MVEAGHGLARPGGARSGEAVKVRRGRSRFGSAWRGWVGRGSAVRERHGLVRRGQASPGKPVKESREEAFVIRECFSNLLYIAGAKPRN